MADRAQTSDSSTPRSRALHKAPVDDDEIDLREVFDLLKSGRWLIASCTAAALFLGLSYIVFVRPTYQVSGLVQVSTSQLGTNALASQALGGLASMLAGGGSLVANAEIQIIQSRLVLNPAIDKLNLLVDAKPHYFPVIGYTIAKWSGAGGTAGNPRPSGAPPLLGRYAWGGESISVAEFETPEADYDQPFTLRATQGGYVLFDSDGDQVLSGKVGVPASGKDNYGVVRILVRALAARSGETFRVTRHARQSVLKNIGDHLDISQQGDKSGVIGIAIKGHDPKAARALVDAIQQSYIAQDIHKNSQQALRSLTYLEAQLPDLRKKLDAAQDRLAAYQRQHGAPNVAAETELLLKQGIALDTEQSQLLQQREKARQLFTPRHPEVLALDRQLATVAANQAKLKHDIARLPDTQQQVLDLQRDLAVDTQLYTTMLDSIEQFQVTKAGTVGGVRIVDGGMLPLKPISPKKLLTLVLALIVGAFVGAAWTLLRRRLLRGVDDPLLIEDITGLQVMASVPASRLQRQLERQARALPGHGGLLATKHSEDSAIEALRSLRTALRLQLPDAQNKLLMFTGPEPGVGKSFISANYAALLAASGARVALVDLDLRRGHLGSAFGLDHAPGMRDVLEHGLSLEEVRQPTAQQGLDLYTHGTRGADAAELLMRPALGKALAALAAAHDHVIIDAPPILAVTDAAIIGNHVGATLLVLEAARHPLRAIDETVKRLRAAHVNLAGVVLNRVGAKAGSYGYGGYGYQYAYNYTSDKHRGRSTA